MTVPHLLLPPLTLPFKCLTPPPLDLIPNSGTPQHARTSAGVAYSRPLTCSVRRSPRMDHRTSSPRNRCPSCPSPSRPSRHHSPCPREAGRAAARRTAGTVLRSRCTGRMSGQSPRRRMGDCSDRDAHQRRPARAGRLRQTTGPGLDGSMPRR